MNTTTTSNPPPSSNTPFYENTIGHQSSEEPNTRNTLNPDQQGSHQSYANVSVELEAIPAKSHIKIPKNLHNDPGPATHTHTNPDSDADDYVTTAYESVGNLQTEPKQDQLSENQGSRLDNKASPPHAVSVHPYMELSLGDQKPDIYTELKP